MSMYTNQTAEELEEMRCTSEGIFDAQNSIFMKINFGLTYILVALTFAFSVKAVRILKEHNVYSNGTLVLLLFTLLNANINQAIFLEIKIRHLVHVITFANDPCQIEFHSPECTYDQTPYAFTCILSTWLVCALTCDRFLAFFVPSFYVTKSRIFAWLLVVLSIILTFVIYNLTYGGVSRAGYVPSCHYPPQLSLNAYQEMTNANFLFIMANCGLTVVILFLNLYKDRQIRQSVYDTKVRYTSFENVLTTKAICSITSAQFLFLSFGSAAVTIIRFFEAGMREDVFHLVAQYVGGLLYGNLCIPALIYLQTNKCIQQRRRSIGKMTSQIDHVDNRMLSLRNMWK